MSRDNQIEDIFEDIFEGRLEVVDKRNGDKLKKASEVAEEIFAEIEDTLEEIKDDFRADGDLHRASAVRYSMIRIAELKKKYTVEMKKIKIGEWVYGKFDIPHCSECGYEPTEISPCCPMCNANMANIIECKYKKYTIN